MFSEICLDSRAGLFVVPKLPEQLVGVRRPYMLDQLSSPEAIYELGLEAEAPAADLNHHTSGLWTQCGGLVGGKRQRAHPSS